MRLALLLPLAVACAGGTDAPSDDDTDDTDAETPAAVGLWRTTSDARDDACTGTLTELELPVPFRQVVEIDAGLEVRECVATDQCNPGSADAAVYTPKGEAWQAITRWGFLNTTENQTVCFTYARRQRLVIQGGGALRGTSETVYASTTEGLASDEACDAVAVDWDPDWNASPFDCKAWEATREE